MANDKFLQVFDLEKGQCEGQGQVYVRQSEVLVVRSVMCKYERNPSRNEKVMVNVKVFGTDRRQRPTTTTDRQADSYISPSNYVCGGIHLWERLKCYVCAYVQSYFGFING